ncbi:MOB kinase activator-like 2 isoform X1 [Eurosta solidaginis]|uniref:MOB kinase activator-like 2 isoform X1 n=1 Tax=Eurosta solidaginis TaxID=178769 RepID=UPI003530C81B
MLRTPTHIVELSTNTTSPLLQKFHVSTGPNVGGAVNGSSAVGLKASSCAAAAAAAAATVTVQYQQEQQQQQKQKQSSNLFCNNRQQEQKQTTTGYRFQTKGMKITTSSSAQAAKEHLGSTTKTTKTTTTVIPTTTAYTPISAARSLLSSTPFISFKRIKKSKTNTALSSTTTSQKTNGLIAAAVVEHVHAPATVAAATVNGQSAGICPSNSTNYPFGSSNHTNNNNNYLKAEIDSLASSTTPLVVKSASSSSTASSTASSNQSAFSAQPLSASASAASFGNANNISCNTQNTAISSGTNSTISSVASSASVITMSPTTQAPTRTSLFDSCHRKIRLIGGGPVAFLGGLVAKARRKERDGDQNSTDTKLYLEESVLERKLPEADLKALVDLPAGLDYNEWLASHTLALFEHVNLVYGTISEFCTPSGCSDMTGPGNRTYLWFDEKGKKTRVAAPQYIDYVMTFTQKTVSDELIFPTKYANEFPSSFESIARKILRLQFHVIAHLYAAHFREIALLGLHTHLNLTFAHLTALHRRFTLIDEKETDVLRDLEVALRLTDDGQSSLASSTITATTDGGSSSGGGGCGGNSNSTTDSGIANSSGSSSGGTTIHGHLQQQQHVGLEDVNLMQHQQSASSTTGGTILIDGDAAAPPICTQPEAKQAKHTNNAHASTAAAVFGGGGGLIGGILGDLSSGEFGDTATRYCTSALPQQHNSEAGVGGAGAVAVNCNNGGAGALHLNFNNNHHHHHHHHHQHAHAHHHTQQQHQQHSGLIQCNANNAPNVNSIAGASATNANTAATTTTTA